MRKRTLSKVAAVILAVLMALALGVSVYADDIPQAAVSGETPPDKPDGDSGENQPEMPGGESGDNQPGAGGDMAGGTAPSGMGGGQSSGVDSYDAVNDVTEDATFENETIDSTGTDENAIHISGGQTVITGSTVTRTSSDSTGGDNSSFYGVGAAILATDGTAYISDTDITTDAKGGAGVFAYGDAVIYVADTTISTASSTSGGIHAAGGGTLYAWDVTATTQGESSAAIRSDRGGGTMIVDGGTYTSNGTGSPAIYCTADISVKDAELVSNNSEAICIEGLNSLALYDCDLSGNMPENEQNDCTWTVILYQSMSGDSEVGCSSFNMQGGTLTSENGGLFYTTNTESSFYIEDVDITASEGSSFFLKCTGNSNARGWGSTGSNGADCIFTAASQEADGDIIWDSVSQLDFYLTDGSVLTGAVLDDEANAGNGGSGYCSLYIDSDCTWVVTADSTLTHLYNAGTIVDENGKTVTIKDASGSTLVAGESSVTITVTDYEDSADMSGASQAASWDEVAVERPELLGEAESSETTAETAVETTEAAAETTEASETSEAAAEETTVAETEAAGETATQNNTALIIVIICVVVAAGIAAILLAKKKKNK